MVGTTRIAALVLVALGLTMPSVLADTAHVQDDVSVCMKPDRHGKRGHAFDKHFGCCNAKGRSQHLFVRNFGKNGDRKAFVRFDLSDVPAGTEVQAAVMRLFVSNVWDAGSLDFHVVVDDWNEEGISGSALPAVDTSFATVPVSRSDREHYITIDVTEQVRTWLADPSTDFGIAVLPNGSERVAVSLDSKENRRTSHGAEIEIFAAGGGGPGASWPGRACRSGGTAGSRWFGWRRWRCGSFRS